MTNHKPMRSHFTHLFISIALFAFPSAIFARCGDARACRNIKTRYISADDVARYAYAAGFRGRNLVIAVAVAGRESAGFSARVECDNLDPDRRGRDGGALVCSTDYGLWQANNNPDNWFEACSFSRKDVLDPEKAAEYAHCITAGGARWNLYNAYRDGSWREYEAVARAAIKRLQAERARLAEEARNLKPPAQRQPQPQPQPQAQPSASIASALFSSSFAAGWLGLGL